MSHAFKSSMGWHEGEEKVQSLLHVPPVYNPTQPGLSQHAARLLNLSSMLALGTLDDDGWPWTTLLGGEPGFVRSMGQSIVGLKALVGRKFDPVVNLLLDKNQDLEVRDVVKSRRPISALGIHLASRDRVKLAGELMAGALGDKIGDEQNGVEEIQAVFAVHRSLGNCPKYINKKQLLPFVPRPLLLSESLPLCDDILKLLAKADMFFISASSHGTSMSTNHRGGPPGFVRVARNDKSGVVLVYPELSGNRFYQTLGDLYTTPRAGLIFPDFDSADALYLTGSTEILFGKDASAILPRSNLAVKINVEAVRFIRQGLAFRGEVGERSPYNPPVRYLPTERAPFDAQSNNNNNNVVYARLLAREVLTPTIGRCRFSISDPEAAGRWKPGQYVALSFEDELSGGYSHMRDDDPRSLNDDYVRTFTVSSPPGANLPYDEFEITIRNVGTVTNFLFKYVIRAGLEVPLRGFAGTFVINQGPNEIVPFVAGGIGITPLLAQLPSLDLTRIRLFWTLKFHDVGLVLDTFERCQLLAPHSTIFLSGVEDVSTSEVGSQITKISTLGAQVVNRRMLASDLDGQQSLSPKWYLCTGPSLRKTLIEWLPGKETIYEDFDY
ncbi:hypothetical protein ACLMJK_007904 [Lecanora helva]